MPDAVVDIRIAESGDLALIASVYSDCFPNETDHDAWVRASFRSYPRGVYYVATIDGAICGYILWCAKNGFRARTIAELEQVAVHPDFAGQGIGRTLIKESWERFRRHIDDLGHKVGAVLVTTAEGNFAERLYESTLGVSRSATLSNYGSGTEVILYRRIEA